MIDASDFGRYFGINIVLQLNNPGGGENVYDALAQGVEGFSFRFDGSALPPNMNVTYTTPVDYCKIFNAPAAGGYLALISETRRSCWLTEPFPGEPDPKGLYRVQFNFTAEATWPTKFRDFDFCIRNLRAQLL
jgi:hypothetical protein